MKFSEFHSGQVLRAGPCQVEEEAVLAFARAFDPQWFHTDVQAARNGRHGGLIASGWHTCAMAMRLMVDNFLRDSTSLGSPGLDSLKWLKPVFPGDTLTLRHTVLDRRAMSSRPDVGLVRTLWEMHNQDGAPVLRMDGWGMFRRRTPGTPAASDARE